MKKTITFSLGIALFILLTTTFPLRASEINFYERGPYKPGIPRPGEVLGYAAGENFTPHAELVRYLTTLAEVANERVRLVSYGKTHEGRTLYLLIFSAPENLARLEEIKARVGRLSDPRTLTPEQATSLIETTPAIAWLSYNVHGNEASTAEAALQVAYQLAAGEDEQTRLILRNCVVIIDPLINPDGHDRYVYFYRGQRGLEPNPDPNAVEHLEPWPGGRFNHYLFDLNRDWAWQSQPESRARIAAYREWNPQLHVDYHEMSTESTYFFFPPAEPIQENIAALLKPWWERYGRANAAAFDRYKVRYYSGEDFDIFYPAYGDSWPSLNGAVGMTYEQAGGGFGGLVIELGEKRGRLTLRERIWHHYLTSLASLATTAQHWRERLRDYYEFRRRAITAGRRGRAEQYVLLAEPDRERTARVVEILLQQGIEVSQVQKPFVAEQVEDYTGQTLARKEFPAGSYIVDLAQPAGFLAEVLLAREIPAKTHFFYDVTGWSLPLAAGIETYALGRAVSAESVSLSARPEVTSGIVGATTPTAYLFRWQSDAAARLLARLLVEDYKAYVAVKAFTLGGEKYGAGTIVLPVSDNPAGLAARLAELAAAEGVTVHAVETQWTEEGIDLGSRRIEFLRKPKVAVVMDTPVNASLYGALWFLFDHQVRLPFTALRAEELSRFNLDDYNVLILPPDSGDGRDYDRIISKNLRERIGNWIRGGGVLIGIKGGAVFATRQKAGWASVGYRYVRKRDEERRLVQERPPEPQAKALPPQPPKLEKERAAEELKRKLLRWEEREEVERREEIPGTIMRLKIDNSHPLGFGYGQEVHVLNDTSPILELSDDGGDNVIYYPEKDFKTSGFLSAENAEKLSHTAYLVREGVGRGHVVLFADTPVFRGFWDGTIRLLFNSIFFGQVGAGGRRY